MERDSKLIVVLNDDETFSHVGGAKLYEVPIALLATDDAIDAIEEALADEELKVVAELSEPAEDEARWWTNDPPKEDDTTVIPAVELAVGHPVVGIVDEQAGGMIAYASPEYAEKIANAMNMIEPTKEVPK